MTYEDELKALSGRVGERNRRLVPIALKGRNEGRDPDTMVDEIVAASGNPPLGEAEVRRAVTRAMQLPVEQRKAFATRRSTFGKGRRKGRLCVVAPAPPAPPEIGCSFVREMIAKGGGTASSADLMALSPKPVPKEPWVQAVHFCMMLEEGDSGLFYTGAFKDKRTREHLKTLNDLEVDILAHPERLPTHIVPNDLTGVPVLNDKGDESYACEGCIRHARHAVIEFDAMPLKEQAAFWKGVIPSHELPLRALVYSGGKSIHGLLRLDDAKDYKEQWRLLERYLASDADKRYRCDLAFRSPVQMMRFPGAVRPETGRRQALLYLN